MTPEQFTEVASRRQLESFIENDFQGVTETFNHAHDFCIPAESHMMTIQQLRKLALYRSGEAYMCACGMIALTDFNPWRIYSRNGNIVRVV